MACDCETVTNVCIFVNPCNDGTGIGITATETGTYTARLEFNGVYRQFGVQATEGEEISILTSLLNESYTHKLTLISPTNETNCYTLSTSIGLGVSGYPTPSTTDNMWQWYSIEDISGNDVESDYLKGEVSPIIWVNGQDIDWAEQGIIHTAATGTLNFVAVGGIEGKLVFQYRNLPQ